MRIDRTKVHAKCGGRCGYCGTQIAIKDMQVDHVIPQWRCNDKRHHVPESEVHCENNYMPACRSCNNYKSGNPLEVFRGEIERQIEILRNNRPTFRLAERYGLIECNPKPIVFYFETINPGE